MAPLPPRERRRLPLLGWAQVAFGTLDSDCGPFAFEAVVDERERVVVALLSHEGPDARSVASGDSERRAVHEGIIATDLAGQREFSWGNASTLLDPINGLDWLILKYSLGPMVIDRRLPPLNVLLERNLSE